MALLKTLVWIPNMETFCGAADLKSGASCTICCYLFLTPFSLVKSFLTVEYHHENESPLSHVQYVLSYIAAFCAFFAFFIVLVITFSDKVRKGKPICTFRNDFFTQIFLILCLIMGFCEVIWGTCTFVRAFIEPGLLPLSNATHNPHPKYKVCEDVGYDRDYDRRGRGRTRRRTSCRPVNDEEKRRREQWDIDHENDTIVYQDMKAFDACFSMYFTMIHLYGIYLLFAFKSRLIEMLEEEGAENSE